MSVYYNRLTPNQMRGVVTRPVAGLDEYNPSVSINDNNLSDLLDAEPYKNDAMSLYSSATLGNGIFNGVAGVDGVVCAAQAIPEKNGGYALLVNNTETDEWSIKTAYDKASPTPIIRKFPISSLFAYGNFESALTGWTASDCGTPTITNGDCTFTATAEDGGISFTKAILAGHRYYAAFKINNPAYSAAEFYYSIAGTSPSAGVTDLGLTSGVIVAPYIFNGQNGNFTGKIRDSRGGAWNAITVYYGQLIDITNEVGTDAEIIAKYNNYGYLPYLTDTISTLHQYDSCVFNTETEKYVCFIQGRSAVSEESYTFISDKLITFNTSTYAISYVDLPFYPKRMVSHANRIFMIDDKNKIWWCRAGDLFTWYSSEYDDDFLKASGNMANGAYAITGVITQTRPITFTVTVVGLSDTYGYIEVIGTNELGEVQSETITPSVGRVQSLKSYKTITSITQFGWVATGTADTIEIGTAPVSLGYVQNDAGYWTIEKEKTLVDLCVLSGNLFIFSESNIYVLSGYSPDSFTLSTFIVDLGISTTTSYPRNLLSTSNNKAYFYNNGDIYEFNGSNYPKLISHPEYSNGNNTNGIYSGIAELSSNYSIVSDLNYVYVYDATTALFTSNVYYKFNIEGRTWVKMSGICKTNSPYTTTAFNVLYVPVYANTSIITIVSTASTAGSFDMHYLLGHRGSVLPFMVTKAFNTNPSELGTLTSLILQVEGTASETANIKLYYSVTSDTSDFVLFKTLSAYAFTGDVQIIEIPLPPNIVPNNHHYRIKVEIEPLATHGILLYNMERRFRVRGRSR